MVVRQGRTSRVSTAQELRCAGPMVQRGEGEETQGIQGSLGFLAAWVAIQETITEPYSSWGTKGNNKVERAPLVKCRIVWQSNEEGVSIY